MMLFTVLIISAIIFLYVLLIIRYAFGWRRIKNISQENFLPEVSVVIAIRNEEDKIDRLVEGLQSQVYDTDKLEFILINDHSTDNTLALLEKLDLDNFQILNMPEGKFGKKNAISMAISVARGDIILSSDADCLFNRKWVRKMVRYFINNDVKLVSGPVALSKQSGIFQNLQALEFISLIGSGAGAIGVQNAIFCNGANMAYRKDVFLEVNNFRKDSAASGDDVFLLHSIKARYPDSIVFVKDEGAIVSTESMQNFGEFVNQRRRWTAKSSSYKDISSIYASYLVFFTNFSFAFLFVILFLNSSFFLFFIGFYFLKFMIDLFLLYPVVRFFNRKDLIKWIFPFEFFYSFYIILIVVLSFTNKFEWKGRTYKK